MLISFLKMNNIVKKIKEIYILMQTVNDLPINNSGNTLRH